MPILRPDATLSSTIPWSGVGSTELWACLDEASPDDADYIHSPNNQGGYVAFSFTLPVWMPPPGTCTLRWRESRSDDDGSPIAPASGGNAPEITIELYHSSTLLDFWGPYVSTPGAWTSRSHTFPTSIVSNWGVVSVRINVTASGGNPNNRRGVAISWLEIELPADRRVLLM